MSLTSQEYLSQLSDRKSLKKLANLTVGIIGDFTLDLYYDLQSFDGNYSLETGRQILEGIGLKNAPGGAGNLAMNVKTLGIKNVFCFGVLGDDLYGRELSNLLKSAKINTSGLIIQKENWTTPTYIKPHIQGEEQNRIDFGGQNLLLESSSDLLISFLSKKMKQLDILLVNQQLDRPLLTKDFKNRLERLLSKNKKNSIYVDCRNKECEITSGILKINQLEMSGRLNKKKCAAFDERQCQNMLKQAIIKWKRPIVMTMGEYGAVAGGFRKQSTKDHNTHQVPGVHILGPIDSVGAGDTFLSCFSIMFQLTADLNFALSLANLASSITVRKIKQTGSVQIKELKFALANSRFKYNVSTARSKLNSKKSIEIIEMPVNHIKLPVNHFKLKKQFDFALLDHDGTISLLRRGWQEIMLKSIVKDVLEENHIWEECSQKRKNDIIQQIEQIIMRTTGIQTLKQMCYFAELVQSTGVNDPKYLDPYFLKKIFLSRLDKEINKRLVRIRKNKNEKNKYILPGAESLLSYMNEQNISIFLTSGTDVDNVKKEANLLGYADYFGYLWLRSEKNRGSQGRRH